jgi:hypothetical protein
MAYDKAASLSYLRGKDGLLSVDSWLRWKSSKKELSKITPCPKITSRKIKNLNAKK